MRVVDVLELLAAGAPFEEILRDYAFLEREDILAYYREIREKDGLTHEEAVRDSIVRVLMSPKFCYRIDLIESAKAAGPIQPLSGYALAISYTWGLSFALARRAHVRVDALIRLFPRKVCRLFDVLAHPDLVKIFGERPDRAVEEQLHLQVVDSIAAAGVAVEVLSEALTFDSLPGVADPLDGVAEELFDDGISAVAELGGTSAAIVDADAMIAAIKAGL